MSKKEHVRQDILLLQESLDKALPIINKIQQDRKSKVLAVYCYQSISRHVAYRINKMLRRMGNIDKLDIILESGGGDIDSAYKILKMFRCYSKEVNVIVPSFAKSAASLIALGANELIMCRGGELGSIDPQVKDPFTENFIPAHSIKEAINFIEETNDQVVKLSLTEKIPVLLVGAYREAGESTKQYLNEIFQNLGEHRESAVKVFTEKFLSHGYPIDREFLNKNMIKVSEPDAKLEGLLFDLHENYEDMLSQLYAHKHVDEDVLLLQTDNGKIVSYGFKDVINEPLSTPIKSK